MELSFKHLDKVYSAAGNIVKAEVLEYYIFAAPLLLPHIKDKPFSMLHFPEGVGGKSFYQKQRPEGAPEWLSGVKIPSKRRGHIDWCLVNDAESILYMVNRSVIEMHAWFSRLPDLSRPDIAVVDLDPSGNTGFNEARILAGAFITLLNELKLPAFPKTTGSRGIHIYIPIKPVPFREVQTFLNKLCSLVAAAYPALATTERTVEKRGDKVYLDAVQNAECKTIAAPYSLRARPYLPVSTPLLPEELNDKTLSPQTFTIRNIRERLKSAGDLFKGFYAKAKELPAL